MPPLRLGAAVVGALVVVLSLALPRPAAACLCAGEPGDGDVIFSGTVTDGPRSFPFDGLAGVYSFDVDRAFIGSPGDARVYTPAGYGGCGRSFERGHKYVVHAREVDPGVPYLSEIPGVPLVTDSCLRGSEISTVPLLGIESGSRAAGIVTPLTGIAVLLVLASALALRASRRLASVGFATSIVLVAALLAYSVLSGPLDWRGDCRSTGRESWMCEYPSTGGPVPSLSTP
jgi:hypothetical protein